MLLDFDVLYSKYYLKIKGVLHIGSHFGQENSIYQKYNIKNKIFFEPLPQTFEVLKRNVTDGILVNKALGSSNSKVKMYTETSNQGQSSSILRPKKHLTQYPHIQFDGTCEVDMIRLDDYEFNREDYNFINMDVQAYELEVLRGGRKTLENIDYIMTEVNRDEVYVNCAQISELDSFLSKYGFKRLENHMVWKYVGRCVLYKKKLIYSIRMKKINNDIFINRSNIIHNNRYDYSLVDYKKSVIKEKIICPEHGIFLQSPNVHLSGHGCPLCGQIKVDNSKRCSLEDFIKRSNVIHNNKYDYSKVEYKNTNTKVKIICKIHGEFEQKPYHHLNGTMCPYCRGVKTNKNIFVEKSNVIHDNKYDYSLVDYKNCNTNVIIQCPIHKEFNQTPTKHLAGHGCPICNESKGEINIRKYLNKNKIKYVSQYRFDGCKDKNELIFDFYLPDFNICIEFDGEQHYNPLKFFGGDIGLIDNIKKDNIKNDYCHENSIKLFRIKYDDNIEESMDFYIKTNVK